jgi:hypothetical protein
MSLLIVTTIICVVSNLVRDILVGTVNSNQLLFFAEVAKLVFALSLAQWLVPRSWPPFNYYFAVTAALYAVINTLVWIILHDVASATYVVLLQHRMFWVIVLSKFLLGRRYEWKHYIACGFVLSGLVIVDVRDVEMPSAKGVWLIVLQAFLASITAVWTEKMMKKDRQPPAQIADDAARTRLYWFCVDSYQMYLFGMPMYAILAVTAGGDVTPSGHAWPLLFAVAVLFAVEGCLLGSVYLWHSAVARALMAAATIPLTILVTGALSLDFAVGSVLVGIGLVVWSVDAKTTWLAASAALLRRFTNVLICFVCLATIVTAAALVRWRMVASLEERRSAWQIDLSWDQMEPTEEQELSSTVPRLSNASIETLGSLCVLPADFAASVMKTLALNAYLHRVSVRSELVPLLCDNERVRAVTRRSRRADDFVDAMHKDRTTSLLLELCATMPSRRCSAVVVLHRIRTLMPPVNGTFVAITSGAKLAATACTYYMFPKCVTVDFLSDPSLAPRRSAPRAHAAGARNVSAVSSEIHFTKLGDPLTMMNEAALVYVLAWCLTAEQQHYIQSQLEAHLRLG